jgi:hypothetical protein
MAAGGCDLVRRRLLPGKTELFDLANDPGETANVAAQHPAIAADLEARLLAYAKQQKPSEWIKAQPAFVAVRVTRSSIRTSISTTAACRMRSPRRSAGEVAIIVRPAEPFVGGGPSRRLRDFDRVDRALPGL